MRATPRASIRSRPAAPFRARSQLIDASNVKGFNTPPGKVDPLDSLVNGTYASMTNPLTRTVRNSSFTLLKRFITCRNGAEL